MADYKQWLYFDEDCKLDKINDCNFATDLSIPVAGGARVKNVIQILCGRFNVFFIYLSFESVFYATNKLNQMVVTLFC